MCVGTEHGCACVCPTEVGLGVPGGGGAGWQAGAVPASESPLYPTSAPHYPPPPASASCQPPAPERCVPQSHLNLRPNMYLGPVGQLAKLRSSPFYPILCLSSFPFLKDTTQSQLIIFQHHSFISTSSSVTIYTNPFNRRPALHNIFKNASTNICATNSPLHIHQF